MLLVIELRQFLRLETGLLIGLEALLPETVHLLEEIVDLRILLCVQLGHALAFPRLLLAQRLLGFLCG
jgi:hypothetical protein